MTKIPTLRVCADLLDLKGEELTSGTDLMLVPPSIRATRRQNPLLGLEDGRDDNPVSN